MVSSLGKSKIWGWGEWKQMSSWCIHMVRCLGNQRNLSGGFTGWLKLMFTSLHQLCIMSSAAWPRQLPLHTGCELISLRLSVPEPFLKWLQEGTPYTKGILGGQLLPLLWKLKWLCWLHYLSFFFSLICRFHCFLVLFLDLSLFLYTFIYLFIFGWTGSSLLSAGFL